MTDHRQRADTEQEARFERLMRRIAGVVLALGLAAAALVFIVTPVGNAGEDAATASIQETRQYQLAMERIGGKAVLLAAQFNDWLASLWHGRRLAGTLALLSVALSGFLYLLGRPPR